MLCVLQLISEDDMEADPVSPVALARLRALLVPIGRMKASDFGCYVEALKSEPCIRLGDVSPDGRSDSSALLTISRG